MSRLRSPLIMAPDLSPDHAGFFLLLLLVAVRFISPSAKFQSHLILFPDSLFKSAAVQMFLAEIANRRRNGISNEHLETENS